MRAVGHRPRLIEPPLAQLSPRTPSSYYDASMSEGPTRARRVPTVVRYAKTRVVVTKGPDTGTTLDIATAPLRIGTADDNDLVLNDDTVSRRHAEIEPIPGGVRVRDMGSTNGVTIGAVRVYDAVLALGKSARMRELFADLERIAPSDATLLIEGETGTGKDVIAESIHNASPRCDAPFVVFDCGAVAATLAESELFGHERGAFTGADKSRAGVFQQAHGGTVFLDEIGELPKDLQPKLLRVLEKQVRPVGGSKTFDVDVRVVAATNRNLRVEVQRGTFREDLYYRLSTAHVVVPPLRDRMDDLELLVGHFLSVQNPPRALSDVPVHVWELFRAHRWPGNVRELKNAVMRLLLTPDRPIRDATLGGPSPSQPGVTANISPLRIARREAGDNFERAYLEAVLARTVGNVTRAAAIAEVSRQMMQKLMRKHGMGDHRQDK